MIYREQSDEINTETGPSGTDVFQQRLSLAMQLTSNIDKPPPLISHVVTAVEVSQGSYVARSNELVKRQQAYVVIKIYYYAVARVTAP